MLDKINYSFLEPIQTRGPRPNKKCSPQEYISKQD